jgi:hypothetical protein
MEKSFDHYFCPCDSEMVFKSKKLLHYIAKFCAFYMTKFPELASKTQVSLINEAPVLLALVLKFPPTV